MPPVGERGRGEIAITTSRSWISCHLARVSVLIVAGFV